jgi:hypothetical protein
MELVLLIGSLILLALAATRWGHDSRRLLDWEPWLGEALREGRRRPPL